MKLQIKVKVEMLPRRTKVKMTLFRLFLRAIKAMVVKMKKVKRKRRRP